MPPPLLVRLRVNIRTMYKITIFIHGFSISISNHYELTIYLPNYDYKRIKFKVHLTLKIFSPSNKSCYHLEHFVT